MAQLFQNPQAAYALLFMPLLFLLFYYQNRTRRIRLQGRFPVRVERAPSTYWLKAIASCLAWAFAVGALMQPVSNPHYDQTQETTPAKGQGKVLPDLILLLDASASMNVADARVGKTRFEYAKDIIDTLVQKLVGGNAALAAFTADAITLAPVSMDLFYLRQQVKQAKINEGDVAGTDFGSVFNQVKQDLLPGTRMPLVLILSDGEDTKLATLKGDERDKAQNVILEIAKTLEAPIYTIGLGTSAGGTVPGVTYEGKPVVSTLDESFLQKLSESTGGAYYRAADYSLGGLADKIANAIEAHTSRQIAEKSFAEKNIRYDQLFQYPLALAILLLLFVRFYPDTRKYALFIILLTVSPYGHAQEDEMRQAAAYFEAGDYQQAKGIYTSLLSSNLPEWQKAFIHYDLGCVELALKEELLAITDFQKALIPGAPDFLRERVARNIAVAYWRLALAAVENIWQRNGPTLIDYGRAITFARLSLPRQPEAKILLAWLLPIYYKNLLNHASPREGLLFLLDGTEEAFVNAKFLENIKQNKNLHVDYSKVYIEEAESWRPLWHKMHAVLEKSDDFDTFLKAEAAYEKALPSLDATLFQEAAELLKKSLQNMFTQKEGLTTVRSLIEKAIAEQEFALLLENLDDQRSEMAQRAHEAVQETIKGFYTLVVKEEASAYQEGKCAYSPWNEVIPLFEKGRQALQTAPHTTKSIEAWREALEKLAMPSKDKSCPQQGSGGTQKDEQDKNAPSLADVLRRLQEMEVDDKLTEPSSVFIQKGERPW